MAAIHGSRSHEVEHDRNDLPSGMSSREFGGRITGQLEGDPGDIRDRREVFWELKAIIFRGDSSLNFARCMNSNF